MTPHSYVLFALTLLLYGSWAINFCTVGGYKTTPCRMALLEGLLWTKHKLIKFRLHNSYLGRNSRYNSWIHFKSDPSFGLQNTYENLLGNVYYTGNWWGNNINKIVMVQINYVHTTYIIYTYCILHKVGNSKNADQRSYRLSQGWQYLVKHLLCNSSSMLSQLKICNGTSTIVTYDA